MYASAVSNLAPETRLPVFRQSGTISWLLRNDTMTPQGFRSLTALRWTELEGIQFHCFSSICKSVSLTVVTREAGFLHCHFKGCWKGWGWESSCSSAFFSPSDY